MKTGGAIKRPPDFFIANFSFLLYFEFKKLYPFLLECSRILVKISYVYCVINLVSVRALVLPLAREVRVHHPHRRLRQVAAARGADHGGFYHF